MENRTTNEITLENYMQNSGTRSSEPLSCYEQKHTKVSKITITRDGKWIEERPKKIIIVDL